MKRQSIYRAIYLTSFFLIAEPFIKMSILKFHSSLEWGLVWENLVTNSSSFSRFFSFWVISPLSGVLLLSLSTVSLTSYFLLSMYRLYALFTFTAYSWPFLTKTPPASLITLEIINLVLLTYIFYPIAQRFFLSKYLRGFWDARGRVDCRIETKLFFNGRREDVAGVIENISSGGALVKFSFPTGVKPFPMRKRSGVITMMDDDGIHHTYEFKVVSHRSEEQDMRIGIEFQHISPKERILLRTHFLEKLFIETYYPDYNSSRRSA